MGYDLDHKTGDPCPRHFVLERQLESVAGCGRAAGLDREAAAMGDPDGVLTRDRRNYASGKFNIVPPPWRVRAFWIDHAKQRVAADGHHDEHRAKPTPAGG